MYYCQGKRSVQFQSRMIGRKDKFLAVLCISSENEMFAFYSTLSEQRHENGVLRVTGRICGIHMVYWEYLCVIPS